MAPAPPPDLAAIPDGTPLAEIARSHGVDVSTVRAWLGSPGAGELGTTGRDAAWLIEKLARGRSQVDIAAELGVSRQRVRQWVVEHVLQRR
jgi:transposase-like protein